MRCLTSIDLVKTLDLELTLLQGAKAGASPDPVVEVFSRSTRPMLQCVGGDVCQNNVSAF